MSRRNVAPTDLGEILAQELTTYSREVTERVNACGKDAMKKLVRLTRANAPVGARGSFKRHIASKEIDAGHGMKSYVWHVKAPDYRLVHLLVHGHATKDGGRTDPDPFLANALDQVLPEYERDIEEAVSND